MKWRSGASRMSAVKKRPDVIRGVRIAIERSSVDHQFKLWTDNWIRREWTWLINKPPTIPIVHHAAQILLLIGVVEQVQLWIAFNGAVHFWRHGFNQYLSAGQHFVIAQLIHFAAAFSNQSFCHRRLAAFRSGARLGNFILQVKEQLYGDRVEIFQVAITRR